MWITQVWNINQIWTGISSRQSKSFNAEYETTQHEMIHVPQTPLPAAIRALHRSVVGFLEPTLKKLSFQPARFDKASCERYPALGCRNSRCLNRERTKHWFAWLESCLCEYRRMFDQRFKKNWKLPAIFWKKWKTKKRVFWKTAFCLPFLVAEDRGGPRRILCLFNLCLFVGKWMIVLHFWENAFVHHFRSKTVSVRSGLT